MHDHKKVVRLLKKYFRGKLGAYFVPPMFISEIPEVIEPEKYDAKTEYQGNNYICNIEHYQNQKIYMLLNCLDFSVFISSATFKQKICKFQYNSC